MPHNQDPHPPNPASPVPPEPGGWPVSKQGLEERLERGLERLRTCFQQPHFWRGIAFRLASVSVVVVLLFSVGALLAALLSGLLSALTAGLTPDHPPLSTTAVLSATRRWLAGEAGAVPLSWQQALHNSLRLLLLAASLPEWPLVLGLRRDPLLDQWPPRLEPAVRVGLLLLRTGRRCLVWPWQGLLALIRLGEAVVVALNLALIGAVVAFFAGWIPEAWISEVIIRAGDRFMPLIQRLISKASSVPGMH